MRVNVLGPLEVDVAGQDVAVPGARQRALLAVLALEVGKVVSPSRLIEAVWGDEQRADPRNALQRQVSQLRRRLRAAGARDVVVSRPAGYLLDLEPEAIDAIRFERLTSRGTAALADGDAEHAGEVLREALALWRGPAFAGLEATDAVSHEVVRLEELRTGALETRIEADLRRGRHAQLIGELEGLVVRHPLRERLRGSLMLALYRCGRQAEALAVYETTRATLAEELGLDPSTDLQRLHTAILTQDPGLELPPTAAVESRPAPAEPRAAAIRLLVVDDDPLVRSAVGSILAADPDIEVVGEAADGREGVTAARRLEPDVVVMDVRMPELDGIQATRQLLADDADVRVIVLTTFDQDEYVVRALEAGASGFLLKRTAPAKLADAVHTVASGDAILDPAVTKQLLGRFLQAGSPREAAPHAELTDDERTAFELLADGRSDADIAVALGLPRDVVEGLVQSVLDKLGARDRAQAVVYAYRHGLVAS